MWGAADKDLSHVGRRACALSLQTSELEADKMRTVSKSVQAAGARGGRGVHWPSSLVP